MKAYLVKTFFQHFLHFLVQLVKFHHLQLFQYLILDIFVRHFFLRKHGTIQGTYFFPAKFFQRDISSGGICGQFHLGKTVLHHTRAIQYFCHHICHVVTERNHIIFLLENTSIPYIIYI